MVKLGRGGMGGVRGRQKPRPLFPPGDLPLFGPPPAFMRRPPGPPIPQARGPRGFGDYGPPLPPPPPLRPPHLGPPMPPPHHPMNMRRRPGPGPPPPPMPLLQAPVMPPRPMPFMRGRPMPHLGPNKRLGKNMKKGKNKKNKNKPNTQKTEGSNTTTEESKNEENVLEGPWITDAIKLEIEKMSELKKKSDEIKAESDNTKLYFEQRNKVISMATAAKMEYISSQPSEEGAAKAESKNGAEEQK